uniref:Uncharacterized protein n=1 Tax=Heterosigma akashiwo TaxID=2829 RepID=A0A6V1NU63_HETAK
MFGGYSGFSSAEEIQAQKEQHQQGDENEETTALLKEGEEGLQGLSLSEGGDEAKAEDDFSKEDLTLFMSAGKEDLLSEETKAELIRKRIEKGYDASARDILFEQQQEVWKTLGRDGLAGMTAVMGVPEKFDVGDEELVAAYQDYMATVREAFVGMIRGSKPAELQSSGSLTKAQVLDFFEAVNSHMTLDATKEELEKIYKDGDNEPQPVNAAVVEMQRDMLEAMGIEKEFGVGELNKLQSEFGTDRAVMEGMKEFAMTASYAVKEAVMGKEQMAKHKEVLRRMAKEQEELGKRLQSMSNSDLQAFMRRVQPTMMSHMQMMQIMQPKDRMRYMQGLPDEERKEMMMFQMVMQANSGGQNHGHSHGGKPCTGHDHGGHSHGHSHGGGGGGGGHSHGGHSHGHSHGGQPCTGHDHAANRPPPPPAQADGAAAGGHEHSHGHSHNGQACTGKH